MEEYKVGIFLEECKNRFLCKVLIDGIVEECYLSCSCKLSHFINLKNRKVLLEKNEGKNLRTKYTLQAVWEEDSKVLLNLNYINELAYNELFNYNYVKREFFVEKIVKTDFYNEKNNEIIEVKGILTEKSKALFPTIKTERAIKQLKEYKKLLKKGYKVKYVIILMNKKINRIELNNEEMEFSKLFKACKKLGMKYEIYKINWAGFKPELKKTRKLINNIGVADE